MGDSAILKNQKNSESNQTAITITLDHHLEFATGLSGITRPAASNSTC
jgi:hypothetical protein